MIILFVLLAILCLLLLLLFMPIKLYVQYRTDDAEPNVYLKFLFFRFSPFRNKKKKRLRKPKKKDAKTEAEQPLPPKKKPTLLSRIRLIFRLIRYLYVHLFQKLHIKIERLQVSVATEDAANTALLYGGVSQAVAYFLEFCDENAELHPLSQKRVFVRADFLDTKTKFDIKICLWLRLITGIGVALKLISIKNKKSVHKSGGLKNG